MWIIPAGSQESYPNDIEKGRMAAFMHVYAEAEAAIDRDFHGDPVAIWRRWADEVEGRALTAGHFLMEESPEELTALLVPFLTLRT